MKLLIVLLLFVSFNLYAQDGEMWCAFTEAEKEAFIVGYRTGIALAMRIILAYLRTADDEVAQRFGRDDTNEELIRKIDFFYATTKQYEFKLYDIPYVYDDWMRGKDEED